MKLITEVIDQVRVIEEEATGGKKNLFIEGVFLQGNIKNRNGRLYNSDILSKEVDRYVTEYVNPKRAFGELGHPSSPTINLDRVSHQIVELRRQGDNFIGKAKISSTPMGNIARGLIEDGAQLGVSSRGMGSLKLNKEGINEVQDDFHLATAADIVADPSAPDAFVNGIYEGVDWIWDNDILVAKKVDDIKEDVERSIKARALTEQKKLALFEKFLNSI
jgi:hypothetical protein